MSTRKKKNNQTIKSYLLVVVCMCVYVSAMLSIAELERSGTWKSSEAALGPSFAVVLMGSRAQLQTTHWHCCSRLGLHVLCRNQHICPQKFSHKAR